MLALLKYGRIGNIGTISVFWVVYTQMYLYSFNMCAFTKNHVILYNKCV